MNKTIISILLLALVSTSIAWPADRKQSAQFKSTTQSLSNVLSTEDRDINLCLKKNSLLLVEAFIKMSPKKSQSTLFKIVTLQSKLMEEHAINHKLSIHQIQQFIDTNLANDQDSGKMWKALSQAISECHQLEGLSAQSIEESEWSSEFESEQDGESEGFKLQFKTNLFKHLDGESEVEEADRCYYESLGECRGPIQEKFDSLPEDQQDAIAEKFQQQQDELQDAILEKGDEATMTWAVDYISEHFASDADTGFIWECVEASLRKCYTLKHKQDGLAADSIEESEWSSEFESEQDGESEGFKLQFKTNLFKHLNEEEDADACYEESLGACREPVVQKFNSLTPEQQEAVKEKFQKQQQDFQAAIQEQGDEATMVWAVDYISEHFASDADTGFIWTCIEASLRKCYTLKHKQDGEDWSEWSESSESISSEETSSSEEQLLFTFNSKLFKHFDEEEDAENCYQESLGECRGEVVAKIQSLSKGEQATLLKKLQAQQKELQAAILEEGESVTLLWVADYIAQHFSSDPQTGFVWSCIESSFRKCSALKKFAHKAAASEDSASEESASEESASEESSEPSSEGTSVETSSEEPEFLLSFAHAGLEDTVQCAQQAGQSCESIYRQIFENATRPQQNKLRQAMRKENEQVEQFAQEQGDNLTPAALADFVEQNFADSPFAAFYTCIVSNLRNCSQEFTNYQESEEDGELWSEDGEDGEWIAHKAAASEDSASEESASEESSEPSSEGTSVETSSEEFKHAQESEDGEWWSEDGEDGEWIAHKAATSEESASSASSEESSEPSSEGTSVETSSEEFKHAQESEDGEDGEWWSEDGEDGEWIAHKAAASEESASEESASGASSEESSEPSSEGTSVETSSEEFKHAQESEDGEDGEWWSEDGEDGEWIAHKAAASEESASGASSEESSEPSSEGTSVETSSEELDHASESEDGEFNPSEWSESEEENSSSEELRDSKLHKKNIRTGH